MNESPVQIERKAMRAVWLRHERPIKDALINAVHSAAQYGFPLVASKLEHQALPYTVLPHDGDAYVQMARISHEVGKLVGMFLLLGQPGMKGAEDHTVPVFMALTAINDVIRAIDTEMHEARERAKRIEGVFV